MAPFKRAKSWVEARHRSGGIDRMALATNSSVSIGATPFLSRNSLSSSRLAFISLAKRACQGGPPESMPNVSKQEKEGAGEGIVGPWGVEQRAFGLRVK